MGIMNVDDYKGLKPGERLKIVTDCSAEGQRTKQEFREECDMNVIIRRFNQSGQLPVNMQNLRPVFADVSEIGDFASAVQQVTAAREAFNALDPDVRARFSNNPVNLVQWLQDDKNYDEAVRLGFIEKKAEVPTPPPVPASVSAPTPVA